MYASSSSQISSTPVNQCAQYRSNPGPEHVTTVTAQRIVRYLAGTNAMKLEYRGLQEDMATGCWHMLTLTTLVTQRLGGAWTSTDAGWRGSIIAICKVAGELIKLSQSGVLQHTSCRHRCHLCAGAGDGVKAERTSLAC
jgi:hypothetical protein